MAAFGLLTSPAWAQEQVQARTPAQMQAQIQAKIEAQTQPQTSAQLRPQNKPPEALAAYFAQVRQAETLQDPEQRCLAYPDLPGNEWPEGAARMRCATVRESPLPLAEIETRLATADGAAWLEQRLETLLDANYSDPRQHDRIFHVFAVFNADARAGDVASQWLRQMPHSPFALTAMGKHRAAQGWNSRGSAYVSKTSEAQLKRMSQLFAGAVPLLTEALEREPRLTPACVALAEIGRQSSDALQKQALAQCLSADPRSYYVVWEWMNAAMPKWGGSMKAMNAVGAYITQHGPENPTLYSLLSQPLGYEASQKDTYLEGLEGFVAASRAGPGARMMADAGRAYSAQNDPWMALVYWSQALRFWPGEQEVLALRGRTLGYVQEYEWALKDLLPAAAGDPADLELQFGVGASLLALSRLEEARPYLLRARKQPGRELQALERYCFSYVNFTDSWDTPQARECTAALVKQQPTYGVYWAWRYQVLSASRDERWVEAAGQFLLYAKSNDPWQRSLKKNLLASGVQPAKSGAGKQAQP